MKKIILVALLSVFGLSGAFSQNWTKEMQKDFRKQKEVAFAVDLSETIIMGIGIEKFPVYYAGKFQSNAEYANMILEKFQNTMESDFYRSTRFDKNNDAPFKVTYKISEITEKGGDFWLFLCRK